MAQQQLKPGMIEFVLPETWPDRAAEMMQRSYYTAVADGMDRRRWVSGKKGYAQFKARPTMPEYHRWREFHIANGRKALAEVACANLSKDDWGVYWAVPAQWPPAKAESRGNG